MKKLLITKNMPLLFVTIFILMFLIIIPELYFMDKNQLDNKFNLTEDSVKYNAESLTFSGEANARIYDVKNNKIIEINYEEYIKGVVASEMQANFNDEALKAQAVAARTFYFSKRNKNCPNAEGGEICSSTHCQVYMNKEECISKWSEKNKEANWEKISKAVDETSGEVLTYEGELVLYPQFFATSSGKTENAVDVFANNIPYLVSTKSEGEEIAPKYTSEVSIEGNEFVNKINKKYSSANMTISDIKNQINIDSYTEGGSIKKIKIGDITISGIEFRKLFNLNSSNFKIEYNNSKINIICKGYGHGVGMSQWGANVMARDGKNYKEILKHYYTGVEINKIKFKELEKN